MAGIIVFDESRRLEGLDACTKNFLGDPAMLERLKGSRRPAVRPACESLEGRALLASVPTLPTAPTAQVSIVPPNGDGNPYGVAVVPKGVPKNSKLHPGDFLVSNFNNFTGLQGTGTTIVDVNPTTKTSTLFFQGPGLGLTQALAVLKKGYVIVGSLPSTDGTNATLGQSSLLLINSNGVEVGRIPAPGGPWGMAVNDRGNTVQVFYSNVLDGTIQRVNLAFTGRGLSVSSPVTISSGYPHGPSAAAFELGPGGLAYDASKDLLYVTSEVDNSIYAVPHASTLRRDHGLGHLIVSDAGHLRGPIGLALGPQNTLIVSNGDGTGLDLNFPSQVLLYTRQGKFLAAQSINPSPGAAFGIAIQQVGRNITFVAVDDVLNTLDIFNGRL